MRTKPRIAGDILSFELMCDILDLIPTEVSMINYKSGEVMYANELFRDKIASTLTCELKNILDMIGVEDYDGFQKFLKNYSLEKGTSSGNFLTKMNINGNISERIYNWSLTTDYDFVLITGRPALTEELYHQILEVRYEEYSQMMISRRFQEAIGDLSHTTHTTGSSWRGIQDTIEEKTRKRFELRKGQIQVKIMEEALETKRMFVRYVSHEIRTPLNVVVSGLQVLSNLIGNTEAHTIIEDLRSACQTATDALNDIMTYENLNANILSIQKTECNPVALVEQVATIFQVQAKHSGISLKLINQISNGSVHILADSMKLNQVVRNLISNAMKFTPTGGSVTLTMQVNESTKHYRLKIQDTGPGMRLEERRKLSNEMTQFNHRDLQIVQGSGLGLYLARKIIDMHEGNIGVDLEWTGPGSIFYLELPYTTYEAHSSVPAAVLPYSKRVLTNGDTTLLKPNKNVRILVVDDVVLCRKFHKKVLVSLLGNTLMEASNGQEAVDKLIDAIKNNEPFDAILMDSSMPFMDGLTATRLIRNMGYTGLIFGVTGNTFQSDIDAFIESGVDEVLAKPLSEEKYKYISNLARTACYKQLS